MFPVLALDSGDLGTSGLPQPHFLLLLLLFSCSVVSNSVTPWTAARQVSLSFIISWSLLKLMFIESMMPSNHLICCHPLLLLPSTFPSIRVFSNESVLCIRWPEYQNFSFSISPSNEHSELISFKIDWFDPCSPRASQESSPAAQFKSINSMALCPFYLFKKFYFILE